MAINKLVRLFCKFDAKARLFYYKSNHYSMKYSHLLLSLMIGLASLSAQDLELEELQ